MKKRSYLLTILVCALFIFTACDDKDRGTPSVKPPTPPPPPPPPVPFSSPAAGANNINHHKATDLCKEKGSQLPTIRKLAEFGVAHGATILTLRQHQLLEGHKKSDFTLIESRTADRTEDRFYYSNKNYKRPASEDNKLVLWSSSNYIALFHDTEEYAYQFDMTLGQIFTSYRKTSGIGSARCIEVRPKAVEEQYKAKADQRVSITGAIFTRDTTIFQFGEAYKDPSGLIWGAAYRGTLTQSEAEKICFDKGGRLPKLEEVEQLAEYLGKNSTFRYTQYESDVSTPVLDTATHSAIWTAKINPNNWKEGIYFNLAHGSTHPMTRNSDVIGARCVAKPGETIQSPNLHFPLREASKKCVHLTKVAIVKDVTIRFCEIPAAKGVLIGTPSSQALMAWEENERPQLSKVFQKFQIAQFEVTRIQYDAVMNPESLNNRGEAGNNIPMVNVTYDEAVHFAEALSAIDATATYRLPTESEFEYAARAGSTTNYYWGKDMDEDYVYNGNTKSPQPVNSCPNSAISAEEPGYCANGFGLYHMLGNVAEWTADAYVSYSEHGHNDGNRPMYGNPNNTNRTVRGGDWSGSKLDVRSSSRRYSSRDSRSNKVGFRLVRVAK